MAVNNGNLHKLPLKSVLNLNRFENEINDYKTYRKLNSPVYGGVLSNFYKKDITSEEGDVYYIMTDKMGREWTKVFRNGNTYVYCNNSLVKILDGETAEFTDLSKQGIVGGTEQFPIYAGEYGDDKISTKYIEKNGFKLLLVLHYDIIHFSFLVDIFDVSGTEKVLLKQDISFDISNTTVFSDYFVTGLIGSTEGTSNYYLALSCLPIVEGGTWEQLYDGSEKTKLIDLQTYEDITSSYNVQIKVRSQTNLERKTFCNSINAPINASSLSSNAYAKVVRTIIPASTNTFDYLVEMYSIQESGRLTSLGKIFSRHSDGGTSYPVNINAVSINDYVQGSDGAITSYTTSSSSVQVVTNNYFEKQNEITVQQSAFLDATNLTSLFDFSQMIICQDYGFIPSYCAEDSEVATLYRRECINDEYAFILRDGFSVEISASNYVISNTSADIADIARLSNLNAQGLAQQLQGLNPYLFNATDYASTVAVGAIDEGVFSPTTRKSYIAFMRNYEPTLDSELFSNSFTSGFSYGFTPAPSGDELKYNTDTKTINGQLFFKKNNEHNTDATRANGKVLLNDFTFYVEQNNNYEPLFLGSLKFRQEISYQLGDSSSTVGTHWEYVRVQYSVPLEWSGTLKTLHNRFSNQGVYTSGLFGTDTTVDFTSKKVQINGVDLAGLRDSNTFCINYLSSNNSLLDCFQSRDLDYNPDDDDDPTPLKLLSLAYTYRTSETYSNSINYGRYLKACTGALTSYDRNTNRWSSFYNGLKFVYGNENNLGITYNNMYPTAITRSITNLTTNISKICSFDIQNQIVYFKTLDNRYVMLKKVTKDKVLEHEVIDTMIMFRTSNCTNDCTNTVYTNNALNFDWINPCLDWNNRLSLMVRTDCGYVYEDNTYNDYYAYMFNDTDRQTSGSRETDYYGMFASGINEQFSASDIDVDNNWCSIITPPTMFWDCPFDFSNELNINGCFGLSTEIFRYFDIESSYSDFRINVYVTPTQSSEGSEVLYRFSIPSINPNLTIAGTAYPTETNVVYNMSLIADVISSYYVDWFIKLGNVSYKLLVNGTTKENVLAYTLLSEVEVEGVFVIQGSVYGYNQKFIVPITYSNGVSDVGNPICNIWGLEYVSSTPYEAIFFSKTNRTFYSFRGDNAITKMFESNRITSIISSVYNPSTQEIWTITNDGLIIFSVDNTFIKIEDIESYDNVDFAEGRIILTNGQNGGYRYYAYNREDEYDKIPVELETEFYGVDDFTSSETDCVYIRLATDEEFNDWVGNVEVYSQVLTQDSKSQDKKVFHIEKSMWDKETNTILLRYQPKYQQGIGFSLGIKSDFPIASIYINSTPIAITNSKNNI